MQERASQITTISPSFIAPGFFLDGRVCVPVKASSVVIVLFCLCLKPRLEKVIVGAKELFPRFRETVVRFPERIPVGFDHLDTSVDRSVKSHSRIPLTNRAYNFQFRVLAEVLSDADTVHVPAQNRFSHSG